MATWNCVNIWSDNGLLPGSTKPLPGPMLIYHQEGPVTIDWVSESVIKFNSLSQTADSKIYVIHIRHVIMTYTSESLSSLTQIIHNLQVTINLKMNKKQTQKVRSQRAPIKLTITWRQLDKRYLSHKLLGYNLKITYLEFHSNLLVPIS